ncbi:methyltransferase [Pseudooceanicola sp. MF1-13]|uniref:methyltransferase n=1 Tax=Pseudooceanicola sp. MF1-13 TaxID=3379095 RepID=UPI00389234E0
MTLHPRLDLALAPGGLSLPEGRIAVIGPRAGQGLDPLPKDRVEVITRQFPDFQAFERQGYTCRVAPDGRYDMVVVMVPRAKALARAWVAQAAEITDGVIVVDGVKDDGIESILKDCRKRADVMGPINKAHGKLFWMQGGDFADWAAAPTTLPEGFKTAPGTFSADGIDPASALLAGSLPEQLGQHVIDLGAGWGYLSAQFLSKPGVAQLDVVEADHAALTCARENLNDPRATFHWADATDWAPSAKADTVVMNPPFHTDRKANPDLGRAFIRTAAASLTPRGTLWMVANRHLPYEPVLDECFGAHEEVAGTGAFKVIRATSPRGKAAARITRRNRLT